MTICRMRNKGFLCPTGGVLWSVLQESKASESGAIPLCPWMTLWVSLESTDNVIAKPLKERKQTVSCKKWRVQLTVTPHIPQHENSLPTQISSFPTDLEHLWPVPPVWEVSSINGLTIFSVISVSTVKVGSTMKSIKPQGSRGGSDNSMLTGTLPGFPLETN